MTSFSIASIEATFLTFLTFLGVVAGAALKNRLDFPFLLAASYAVGLSICLLTCLVLIILPTHLTGLLLFFTLAAIFVGLLFYNFFFIQFSRKEILGILFYLTVFYSLSWILSYNNFMVASPDSLYMMQIGEILAHTGVLDPKMTFLGKWSIAIPVFQTIANFLQIGSFAALLPLLLVPLLFGFLRGGWLTMIQLDISKSYTLLSAIMGTLFLGTAVFIQWNGFYINAHLASGLYLLLFVITILLACLQREGKWLFISSLFLTTFCIWRIEGIAFAAIFLFLLLPGIKVSQITKLIAGLLVLLPVAGWYLYLYNIYAPANDFLNEKMLFMIASMILVVIFTGMISQFSIIRLFLSYGPQLLVLSITLVLLFLTLSKPSHMATSFNSILGNIFLNHGWWKMGWLIVFPLLILSQGIDKTFPLDRRLLTSLIFFGVFLLAISYFRVPYRLSHWDSANRMLVHIFPCCLYYIVLKFGISTLPSLKPKPVRIDLSITHLK